MTANVMRWLLLLAVILAILGAIQCPKSPDQSRCNPLRSFRDAITRTLSRNQSGSYSRSSLRGAGDGENSGRRQPPPGNNSGARLPRSRSSSPPAARGGGAGGSSSLNGPPKHRLDSSLPINRITLSCRQINKLGDGHVITNMQVYEFANIIRKMQSIEATDECTKAFRRGGHQDSINCQEAYVEFKKIPAQYRGECSEAISAHCWVWPGRVRTYNERKCSFYIKTGMRTTNLLEGYFVSLTDCINGIKNDLFMDRQLSSLGINPPENPPQPLLPSNYSPDH